MAIKRRLKRKSSLLDTTPMTDIVFLLLIFFMLSSSFLVEPGIKLKLPKTVTSEIQEKKKLVVSIKEDNSIYLNDRPVHKSALEEELKLLLPADEERLMIIRADARVLHGLVTEVLDIAKSAGAEKLAIATEKKARGD